MGALLGGSGRLIRAWWVIYGDGTASVLPIQARTELGRGTVGDLGDEQWAAHQASREHAPRGRPLHLDVVVSQPVASTSHRYRVLQVSPRAPSMVFRDTLLGLPDHCL